MSGEGVAVLEAAGLTKRFSGLVAVDDVTLAVRPGEVHGVIGPNGAGKSTLIGCLAGTQRPTRGTVRLHGRDVTRERPHRRCRRGLARTFQTPRPFGELTVRANVEIAARFGGSGDPGGAGRVLARCGIAALGGRPAADLTHGQQRRLELARALATEPRVLLLDEVGAGLDGGEIDEVDALVRELAADGMAVLMVEHVLGLVMNLSDRVTVLDSGAVIATGAPDVVAADARVVEAYLGVS